MDDGAPTRAELREAAVRTRAMHRDGRRCWQCREDAGCDQLAWADRTLTALARQPAVGRRAVGQAGAILLQGTGG